MSKYEEEAVRLVGERKHTIGRRLRKMILKTLIVLFVFSMGFILGERVREYEILSERRSKDKTVCLCEYEDLYTMLERGFSKQTGLPSESPEVVEYMAEVRKLMEMIGRPLAAVGPFAVFVNHEGDKFSVHEMQSLRQEKGMFLPLVELEFGEQSKRLYLLSSQEKDCPLPRFRALLNYSGDGTYEGGVFSIHREDGTVERVYTDSKGVGVFDVMNVFENGVRFIYSLNNLTWELVDELHYPEKLKNHEDGLLKDFRSQYH